MTVVLTMKDGSQVLLDRQLRTDQVFNSVNEARGKGKLIPFQNNASPSRTIYLDPDEVMKIDNDGLNY